MKHNLLSSYYRKLVFLTLFFSIVPISLVGVYLYIDKISSETESLKNRLNSLSAIGASNVNQWLDDRKTNVDSIAHNQLVISNTKQLLESEYMSKEYFEAKFELEKQSAISLNDHDWLLELIITEPNSKEVVFYTGFSNPKFLSHNSIHLQNAIDYGIAVSDVFKSDINIKNEFGSYEKDVPTMMISAPIKVSVALAFANISVVLPVLGTI